MAFASSCSGIRRPRRQQRLLHYQPPAPTYTRFHPPQGTTSVPSPRHPSCTTLRPACAACAGVPACGLPVSPIDPRCPCGRAYSVPVECSHPRCLPQRWRLVSAQYETGWSGWTLSQRHVSRSTTPANPRRPRYTPPQVGSSRFAPRTPSPSRRPQRLSPPSSTTSAASPTSPTCCTAGSWCFT